MLNTYVDEPVPAPAAPRTVPTCAEVVVAVTLLNQTVAKSTLTRLTMESSMSTFSMTSAPEVDPG